MLRRIKKRKINREEYVRKRRDYKIWCEEERKRHEKEEKEKINNIRTKAETWNYVNKYGKKRERIDEDIKLESWKNYFMDLLEGTKRRVILELEERKEEEEEKEEEIQDITKEELIRQLKRLKMAKAGKDGIENEAWRYMSKEIGEVFWKLLNNIWRKGELPEDWNKGIISPIYKKDEKSEVKNYRGVTLMDIT